MAPLKSTCITLPRGPMATASGAGAGAATGAGAAVRASRLERPKTGAAGALRKDEPRGEPEMDAGGEEGEPEVAMELEGKAAKVAAKATAARKARGRGMPEPFGPLLLLLLSPLLPPKNFLPLPLLPSLPPGPADGGGEGSVQDKGAGAAEDVGQLKGSRRGSWLVAVVTDGL